MDFKDFCVLIAECLRPHVSNLDPPLAAAVCKGMALLGVEFRTGDHLQAMTTDPLHCLQRIFPRPS